MGNEFDFVIVVGHYFLILFISACVLYGLALAVCFIGKWLSENIAWDNLLEKLLPKKKHKRKIYTTRREWRRRRGDFFWFLG